MGPALAKSYDRNNSLQDLPIWVRATAIVGIPGVIAFYLIWLLGNTIPAKLDAHADESRQQNSAVVRTLQQICSNTATTPEEKAACWGVR